METDKASLLSSEWRGLWSYLQGMETGWACNIFSFICFGLWSYLQGMETSILSISSLQRRGALILPTRDGNHFSPIAMERNFLSFDPTYKGWKPNSLFLTIKIYSPLWSYLQGMETDNLEGNHLGLGWGFDPTYKGWKRFCYALVNHLCHQLWSYLQGMETGGRRNYSTTTTICFDPTYKGWKLMGRLQSSEWTNRLWSYLQGMETFYRRSQMIQEVSGFDPTYKGWKLE